MIDSSIIRANVEISRTYMKKYKKETPIATSNY